MRPCHLRKYLAQPLPDRLMMVLKERPRFAVSSTGQRDRIRLDEGEQGCRVETMLSGAGLDQSAEIHRQQAGVLEQLEDRRAVRDQPDASRRLTDLARMTHGVVTRGSARDPRDPLGQRAGTHQCLQRTIGGQIGAPVCNNRSRRAQDGFHWMNWRVQRTFASRWRAIRKVSG